jgi:heme-degrading monooxygenase HmoA
MRTMRATRAATAWGRWRARSTGRRQGRDLAATTDFRQVLAGVCATRLGLSDARLADVFPGFTGTPLDPARAHEAPGRGRMRRDAAARLLHNRPSSNTGRSMILEHADITILAGRQAEFDAAIQRGVATVLSKAAGFRGFQVHKGIESPQRYLLTIRWDTLENHTVDFRGGPLFAQWRAIVGPFFAQPPVVEHFDLLAASDGAD